MWKQTLQAEAYNWINMVLAWMQLVINVNYHHILDEPIKFPVFILWTKKNNYCNLLILPTERIRIQCRQQQQGEKKKF